MKKHLPTICILILIQIFSSFFVSAGNSNSLKNSEKKISSDFTEPTAESKMPPSAPANDDPGGAISLTPAGTCTYATYTNANATATSCGTIAAPGCASYSGGDVWFKIVVPAGGGLNIDTQTGVMTDGGMAAYTGTACGAMSLISCDDDNSANGLMPYLSLSGLTVGSTIFIRVWEYGNDNNGTFGICVTTPPLPPANDNCTGATTVTSGASCTSVSSTTSGATQSQVANCAGTANDDVWFSFVATQVNQQLTVTSSASFDPVVEAYSGSCASLTSIKCDDIDFPSSSAGATTLTGLTVGQTYFYRVYDYSSGVATTTTFTTCVQNPPPPNNQDCLDAIPVCQNQYTQAVSYSGTGNITGEINSALGCLASGEKNDVWYQFTVQSSGKLCFVINPNVGTEDYDWAVYNLTTANCSDIATNAALQVACNYSGQTTYINGTEPAWATGGAGNTGLLPAGTWNATNFQDNDCINVTVGQTFVLNVSNFASSTNGYTLTFPPTGTAGMAQIFDNIPPTLQSIGATPACGATSLTFNFSENIKCTTVSAADFTLSGPGGTYTVTAQTSANCAAGGEGDNSFTITISPAITTAGTYSLCLVNTAGSVTDFCNNVAAPACLNFTVAGPSVTATQVNVSCNGGANGSLTATATGGSGSPYTYSLNGGAFQSSGTFSSLAAGTYTVIAKDGGGCQAQVIVTITQPTVLNITATPTNATCAGNNGSIATTVTGGTSAYTYAWAPSGSGANPSGLSPATYTVTVTDAKGCTDNTTAVIAITGTVTSTFTSGANQCLTGNTFTFTNTGTSAGGPTYSWSFAPAAGAPATSALNNYGPVSFTTAGTYTVSHTVTIGSCTSTTTQNITIFPMPVAPTITMTPTTCGNNNGTITVTAPTGAGITYSHNASAFTATTNYTGLATGTHTITVKDANGCTSTGTIVVTATPPPTAVVLTPVNSTCGNANGSFTIGAVTGGTAGFTYSVNASAFTGTTSYTALAAATYTVVVKDANGCTYTQNVVIANTPGPTALAVTSTNSTCGNANGTVTIGATTGGTAAYTYSFNGSGFTATTSYTALAAGTYNVIVKDANGCQFPRTITVANTPGPTAVVLTPTNASCGVNNGTVTIGAVTGGTAAYTYSYDGSGFTATTSYTGQSASTHTVIVKDANGCQYTQTVIVNNNTGPTALAVTHVNTTCGNSNGSLTIGATTGGTAAYTYSVNGSAFTATTSYTALAAGTYTVVVKDANGCQFTVNPVISNIAGPTALALTPVNSTCGAANGTVTVGAVTGGTAAYTYSFNASAFTATTSYTGLTAATYTVIVKDANGCQFTQTTVVANTPGPTAIANTSVNPTCGIANGSITIGAITGGTAAYTYSFNASAFTATTSYTSLAAGTYTIIVKDANGCQFTKNVTITNVPGPTALAVTSTNSTCGNANGTVTIGATTGGTAAYTYSFNGSGFTATTSYTSLAAGTYNVIVQDANGCQFPRTITVTNTPGPTAVVLTPTNASCGVNNGTVTIGAVTGGTAAYTYSYDGSGFTATTSYTGQSASTHTVIVKDANGCQYTQTVVVNNSSGPTALAVTPVNATCGNSNGSLTIGATTGGLAAYTYSVNGSAFTATTSYTGLAAGTYTVVVKDANGCQFTTNPVIANIAGPTAIALTPTNSLCGAANGSVAVGAVTGGTAAYTYSFNASAFTGTINYTGLTAATYTVIVKDANGCTFTQTTVVANTPGPTAVALTPVNSTCGAANGTVTIGAVTGGTAAYTYSFNASAFTATTSYTGLTAATYTVIVKDANGCQFTQTTVVANTPGPTAQAVTSTNSTCGNANGTATIGATTGGTAAYTYSFNGGAFGATTSYTGLSAGSYAVIVKDANGCQFTTSVTVTNTPGPTAVTLTPTNASCGVNNGTVTIGAVTGGTAAYTYSYDGSAFTATTSYTSQSASTHTVIVKDANGCQYTQTVVVSNSSGPTAVVLTPVNATCGGANGSFTIGAVTGGTAAYTYSVNGSAFTATTSYTALSAGTYSVDVKDANGCIFSTTVAVSNSGGPTALAVSSTNSACASSTGTVTIGAVTGGLAAYTYSFNGSAFTATTSYTNIAPGTYNVIVKDASGCQFSTTVTVGLVAGPTAVALTPVNSTCGAANGTVTIGAVTGGTAAYTYSFNASAFTATTSYTGLSAATETVIVKDANGCTFTQTVVVANTPGPTALAVTSVNAICGNANGVVNVGAVTGGTAAYTYNIDGGAFSGTVSYTGLTAATHTVIVKDANGCTFTQTIAVANTPGPTAQAVTNTNSTCGNPNGTVSIGATTGGTAAYTYNFNGGAFSGTTSYTALAAGTYTVIVKDANGCTFTQTTVVSNVPGPSAVVLTPVNSTCGAANGTVTIGAVTSGTAPFTYSFNGSAFTATTSYTGLTVGTYTVDVKDANGCIFTATSTISNSGGPSAVVLTPVNSTCSASNGAITVGAVTGGAAPYTYSLDGSAFTGTLSYTGLAAGTHTVIVKDNNGCQFTQTTTVIDTPGPTAVALTPVNSTCGAANGTVTIGAVTGGTAAYTYSFNASAFTATTSYTGLSAATETVIVKDANGCTFTQTVVVADTPGPTALAVTSVNSTCGNANGVVNVGAVTGGTAAYTYNIDGGAFSGTVSYTGLTAATHTVIVKDANGCTFTQTIAVANTPGPTAQAVTNTNETCTSANGTVSIGATTGGTAAYTYNFNGGAFSATTSYTGLAAGTYTVIVQDANNCQFTQTTVVSNVPGPSAVVLTPVNSTCGAANGTITIGAVTSGTAPFTYSFNGSAFTATTSYTGLLVGTYTVVVQDANNCQFTQTAIITNSGGPTAVVLTPVNSTCSASNGTITVGAVTGGAVPYTYSLDGSAFTGTLSYTGLAAGTHTVIVKDNNGCQFTQTTTIIDTPGPTAVALTPVNSTCGAANGTVTIGAVTGGTAAYTYSFNASAFTATTSYTGLSAATETVIVKDANGCTFTQTVVVVDTPGPTALALTTVNSTCGAANGIVNVGAVTGGTSTYTYSLNGGAFSSTVSYTGLTAATYTVVVKDANGCTFTQTVAVADTPGPTAQAVTSTNETCTAANGTVSIGATTGGTAAYTYNFNGGGFSATTSYTGLSAGTYPVIVEDANGCTFTTSVTFINIPGPTAITLTSVSSNCGGSNGSVSIGAVTGGTAPYTYSFNGSAFTGTTNYPSLISATYTVDVKDANGCVFTQTIVVNNVGAPTASIAAQTNVSCNAGANGSVTIAAAGGAGGYTYAITPGGTSNGTGIFTGLAANTYTVTITEPTALTSAITAQTNVSCNAGTNGSVTVAGSAATPAYTYSLNGGAFQASGTFNGMAAGSYIVTVKDNNGCTVNQPVVITEPPVLVLNISPVVDANCTASNGTATVNPTGGTPGYTYSWSGGGGTGATTVGLPAGTYTATVTDNNGCIKTATATIAIIPGGIATMSTVGNVTCNGANNGTLTVSMGGNATAPFTYVWSPNVGSTATVTNLAPAGYTVTVTDNFGCITTTNATISQPIALNVTLASVNVSCNGGSDGSINTTVTGGTGAVTYLWSPGAFTTANVSGLPIGTYSVIVTDANNCTATANQTLVQPTALVITPVVSNPHCNQADGSMTVTGSGGAGGYNFSINGGTFGAGSFSGLIAGTYTVGIKDGNQCTQSFPVQLVDQSGPTASLTIKHDVLCNGGTTGDATVSATGGTGAYTYLWNTVPAQTTPTATNLPQGIFSVNITDASGCVATVGVTINEPPVLILNTTFTNPVCNGNSDGTAIASAFGGTPGYSYVWSPAPTQTTPTAVGLVAGPYNVIVTDGNGCTQSANLTLTNPPAITATITKTDLSCFNICAGSAIANVSNGTSPFTFSWNDPNGQSTATATGLCAGSFTVNITDLHGCTASASTTLTQPTLLTTTISSQSDVTCSGLCNGSGTVSPAGGTPPYAYSWTSGGTAAVESGLCANSYTATVTDANGCTSQSPLNITQPTALTLTTTHTDASCFGVCDATATANFGGGTAPYIFLWQNSLATTFNPTGLCAGTQTVTLTDANNCTINTTVTINQPNLLSVQTVASNNAVCGQSNGSAQAAVTGGTGPFIYLWNNGTNTLVNNGLFSGTYSITVTDANGCTANAGVFVQDTPGPTVTISAHTNISCFGMNDGTATATIVGGAPAYITTWLMPNLNPNPTQNGTGLYPGVNYIKVVDAAGCVSGDTVTITQPTLLVSAINNINNVTCNGLCNGSATMLANGGTPAFGGYNYLWTDASAQTIPTAINLCAGNYTCTVTDANGCTTNKPVTITEPLPITITLNSLIKVDCYNNNNGQISVTPSGGTPPFVTYSWSPGTNSLGGALNGPVATNLSGATLPNFSVYNLTVTDVHGCTSQATYNISQPDSFRVVSNFTPSTCSNSNGTVSVVVNGATPAYAYQWNGTGNQTTATATGLSAPAPYTCVITDANGCTKSVTINLVDQPGPSIDSTRAVNVSCNGFNDGVITVYPKGGTGTLAYTWSNGSGASVGTTASVPGVPAGIYNVLVTDANNCPAISTISVIQPQPLVMTNSTNMTACNGQTLGVYAAAGGGTVPYIFTWSGAGTGLVGGGNHNVIYTNNTAASVIQSYSVIVTDAHNCPAVSGQFNVTVLPRITITPTNATSCDGDLSTLQASATGGDGAPYQFTWSTAATNSGTTSTISVPANVALSPQTFTVTVDDGCSIIEDTIVKLTVNPRPIAGLIGVNLTGCSDLNVTFAGSNGGFAGSTYAWDFGDGQTSIAPNPVHTYTNNVTYDQYYTVQLIVTSPLGCKDTATNIDYVTVYPKPVAQFVANPGTTTTLYPVVNFVNGSQDAVAYAWNFGDPSSQANTSALFDPMHEYENSGYYTIHLTATSLKGCVDTTSETIYVEPDYALYVPNAFSPNGDTHNEVFQPKGLGIDESKYHLYIFNRWGEQIFESNNFNTGWDGKDKGGMLVQEDVYVWKIMAFDVLGNKHNLVGHVTVVK